MDNSESSVYRFDWYLACMFSSKWIAKVRKNILADIEGSIMKPASVWLRKIEVKALP